MAGSPLPSTLLDKGSSLLWRARAFSMYTTGCSPYHTPAPSGCLCSQPQCSPQVCPLKPEFQHPAPARTSGCASQAEERRAVAWLILLSSEGASQSVGTFSLSQLPPRGTSPVPIPFFSFALPSCVEILLAILGVGDILPAFSRYFVRIVPDVDVFLLYLWAEVSSLPFYSAILIGAPQDKHF